MSSTLTTAQQARQDIRHGDGRYAEMGREEPVLDLSPDPEPDPDIDDLPLTWRLTAAELALTKEKLAKINARAQRRGFTGRLDVETTPVERAIVSEGGVHLGTEILYETRVVGDPPSYGGWTFLAAVDTTGPGQFVVRKAPGLDDEEVDRSALVAGACEHCGSQRSRKATYLVRHAETGQTMQVGSTCIVDFTGHQGRLVFLSDDDLKDCFDHDERLGGGAELDTQESLAIAAALVEQFGYVRAGEPGSTKGMIYDYLYGTSPKAKQLRAELLPAPAEQVADIVATMQAQPARSDYIENLQAVLSSPAVGYKHMGILASAVVAYQRVKGSEAERAAAPERPNAWFGGLGERLPFKGTVVRAITIDGYMPGSSQRIIVIDTPQGTVKTFTTAEWAWDVEEGTQVEAAGTVKDHSEYQGHKETVMTRIKVAPAPPSPSAPVETPAPPAP